MEDRTFTSVQHDTAGKSQTSHNKSVAVNMGININKPYFEISAFVILASDRISVTRDCLVGTPCCFCLSSPAMKIQTEFLSLLCNCGATVTTRYVSGVSTGDEPGGGTLGGFQVSLWALQGRATQQLHRHILKRQISNL